MTTTYILPKGELVLMPSGEIHYRLDGLDYIVSMAYLDNTPEDVDAGIEMLKETAKKESETK